MCVFCVRVCARVFCRPSWCNAVAAGYDKEMETFFEANPGFKSRVPFKLPAVET